MQPYAGSEGYKNWSGRQDLNIILNSLFNIFYFINNVSIYRNLYRIFLILLTRLRYAL